MLLLIDIKALKKLLFVFTLFECSLAQAQSPVLYEKQIKNSGSKPVSSTLKPESVPAQKNFPQVKSVEISTQEKNVEVVLVEKTAPKDVDINTLPLFGGFEKSEAQKITDNLFLADCQKEFESKNHAAEFFSKIAWQYLEEGDKLKAISRFNYAFLLNPEFADIYWGLGVIEYQNRKFSHAISLFIKGLEKDPENITLMLDLATVYIQMATENKNSLYEINQAKNWINQALNIQPSFVNAYLQLTVTHIIENNLDLAWESFHKAVVLNPTDVNLQILTELLDKKADPKGIFKK
jgi:tetratricopeptide (TPR) repeat protein